MGPGLASGPHSRLLAFVRFGDCHSGWEVTNRLRMSRSTGIAACFARLPGFRSSRLRVPSGSRRNRSGDPKGPAIIDRTASPASGARAPAAIASPGGGALTRAEARVAAPFSRRKDQDRRFACPSRVVRIWPRPLPSFRRPDCSTATLPVTLFAALQACFPAFRRPRSVGWRTLIGGRIACRSSLCFSRTCIPIRSRFFLRDKAKLRPIGESRKTYFRHLSTSCALAVDNRDGPQKCGLSVRSDRAPPATAAAAR